MTVLNQTVRAEAIDLRTYRRPLDDSGSAFETREQMLRRAMVDHQKRLWKDAGGRPDKDELSFLESLGLAGLASLAGRTQWLGGTTYSYSRPCSQFNCAGTGVATVYDMVDAAWLLLNGCGVGFKPVSGTLHGYRKPIRDLQIIPSEKPRDYKGREQNIETLPTPENNHTWTIAVGDSAEAWAKAGGKLFAPRSLNAERLVLDFSEIRGPGGRLKGYGWIANGAPPLIDAFRKFNDLLNDAAGNLLDEIQILDVMNLWGTVLSSRRAAELALLDSNNPRAGEFAQAKKDYWLTGKTHRRQSNNTLLFWSKPPRHQIEELIRAADECGGDPGIANGNAAIDRCPWFYILNPCQPGFATVCTPAGIRTFDDIEEGSLVWSETGWTTVTKKWSTGTKAVYRYQTTAGEFIGTKNHRVVCRGQKVESGDADAIDVLSGPTPNEQPINPQDVVDGLVLGDGMVHRASNDLILLIIGNNDRSYHDSEVSGLLLRDRSGINPKAWGVSTTITPQELPRTHARVIPQRFVRGNTAKVRGFLRGLYSANGSVCGGRVTLKATSIRVIEAARLMLSSVGIRSYVTTNKPSAVTWGNGRTYTGRESYDLNISTDRDRFASLIGFIQPYKQEKLLDAVEKNLARRDRKRKDTFKITSVEYLGDFEVFDITVDNDPHTYWTGGVNVSNCAEILLPRTGFCNLSSNCLPRFRRNFNLMERSVYTIARANYRQTCVNMEDGTLQPSWHQTNQSLRLCGVSMTGIVQADWLTDHQIRRLRNAAIAGAYSMADELNLPRPKAVCTIKPEGTGTKTLGSTDLGEITEGIHRPLGKYIFNWVNFSTNDPLVSRLESAGYRVMLNPSDANNTLVCFPVEYHGVKFTHHKGMDVNLEPAIDQLNRYKRWNTLWADYNVSCTVSYSPNELHDIADWIDQNWDNGFVAVSLQKRIDPTMKPADVGHPYLPQEVVTHADYMVYKTSLRQPDLSSLMGIYDISEEACSTGVCPTR